MLPGKIIIQNWEIKGFPNKPKIKNFMITKLFFFLNVERTFLSGKENAITRNKKNNEGKIAFIKENI